MEVGYLADLLASLQDDFPDSGSDHDDFSAQLEDNTKQHSNIIVEDDKLGWQWCSSKFRSCWCFSWHWSLGNINLIRMLHAASAGWIKSTEHCSGSRHPSPKALKLWEGLILLSTPFQFQNFSKDRGLSLGVQFSFSNIKSLWWWVIWGSGNQFVSAITKENCQRRQRNTVQTFGANKISMHSWHGNSTHFKDLLYRQLWTIFVVSTFRSKFKCLKRRCCNRETKVTAEWRWKSYFSIWIID